MVDIINKIIEMSVLGSVVILLTIVFRRLLKKQSKSFIMILWIAVALRLLCPIGIESQYSLFNLMPQSIKPSITKEVKEDVAATPVNKEVADNTGVNHVVNNVADKEIIYDTANENSAVSSVVTNDVSSNASNTSNNTNNLDIKTVLAIIWSTGASITLAYVVISYIRLKLHLKGSVEVEKGVFESDRIPTPFVFGLVKPRIYIPLGLGESEKKFILTHERIHIEKRDYLSKMIGTLCICIHWFNPVVWVAFSLFEHDLEMRCDEEVIKKLGSDIKENYSISIVSFAARSKYIRYQVMPVAFSKLGFSKNEVTVRVKNLINYKKSSKIVAALLATALFVISTACSLNAISESPVLKTEKEEDVVVENLKAEISETVPSETTSIKEEEIEETKEVVAETEETSESEKDADTTEETEISETEETTETEVAETSAPATNEAPEVTFIKQDIQAIKEYHSQHPNENIYIDWEISENSETHEKDVKFFIYQPGNEQQVYHEGRNPLSFTIYQTNSDNARVIEGDEFGPNMIAVTNSADFNLTYSNSICPAVSYDKFVNLSVNDILATSRSGASGVSVSHVSSMPDGVYFAQFDSSTLTADHSAANFYISKPLTSVYDNPIGYDEVYMTCAISADCVFYENGYVVADWQTPTTFENSIYMTYLMGGTSDQGHYDIKQFEGAIIRIENNTVVAMDFSYWT